MKRIFLILALLFAIGPNVGAQPLKIISFNIRYNSVDNVDGDNGWLKRRDAVAKMINTEQPAAIGLQEALIDQLHYLDERLSSYKRVGVGRDDGKEDGEFMAIYYDTTKLRLVSATTKWLSSTPDDPSLGWDAACRRTVTVAHFIDLHSKKGFYYLNTHLDHVGRMAREEGTKLITKILNDESIGGETTVIVGGDMNTTIDDPIFRNFFNYGLQPARDMTKKTSHVDTYNGFGKGRPSLIDHFFIRKAGVESFRTLNTNYGVPYISDHYPIAIAIIL